MYKAIIRPFFFLIDAEKAHKIVVLAVKFITSVPGLKTVMKSFFSYNKSLLSIDFAGLKFNNRVGLAAGFDKNADYYSYFSVFGFSFIEIGTVTPLPQPGNPKPRLFRLPKDKALINRMGFNNKGVKYAAKQLLKRDNSVLIGGNIGKNTATPNDTAEKDYIACFKELYDQVDYLVINVSCPNIAGLSKLQDQESLEVILKGIMTERANKISIKPVLLKISPDLSADQLNETMVLYKQYKLDGLVVSNTTTARNHLETNELYLNNIGTGGLSGAPLKNRTLKLISYICKQYNNSIPIIGVGGIMNANDALNMIKAGATLVQVYTGFIYDGPFLVKRINRTLERHFSNNKMNKIN
jgi:dihydroorotate dehydrogenase